MNERTQTVPERNRAVKRLLQHEYPGIKISVRAGDGTAYHWIMVEFGERVDRTEKAIEDFLINAGIYISTFNSDGDYTGRCISIRMPHKAQP